MAKLNGKQKTPITEFKTQGVSSSKSDQKSISVDGQDLYLKISNYGKGKLAMCLDLETADGEPYATISKCFGNFYRDETFVPNCSTFIDTNNCPQSLLNPVFDALGARPRTVFGEPYMIQSGFCEYPIYDFNPEKLKEYDAQGFAEYQNEYAKNFSIEQRNLNIALFGSDIYDDFEME